MNHDFSDLSTFSSEGAHPSFENTLLRRSVDYRGWLLRVFCWDGILPAGVLALPQTAMALGADRLTVEFLSVTMPLLAFFIRIPFGFRRIGKSFCGPILQGCQFVVFFLAAVFLVGLDAMTILALDMNNGRLWLNQADFIAFIVLWSAYFLAMLFVFYPGRSPVTPEL